MKYSVLFVITLFIAVACQETKPSTSPSSFIDKRDGQEYPILTFGNQRWMVKNLAYKTAQSMENTEFAEKNYGQYYTWEDACQVCPEGWHLPSDEEWKKLESWAGIADNELDSMDKHRGKDIEVAKSFRSTSDWMFDNNGTNTSGFNVVPAGHYVANSEKFWSERQLGAFWTSTEDANNTEDAILRGFYHYDFAIYRGTVMKKFFYPVRCIQSIPQK